MTSHERGRPPLREGRRRCATALFLGALAATPAAAQWDLSSDAGALNTWSENPTYTGSAPNSDSILTVRLRGEARWDGQRSRFQSSYRPNGIWYRENDDLNRVSHFASTMVEWDLTPRSRLGMSESYFYTPEQGSTSTSFNTPVVLTRFSDRRSNNATIHYTFQPSSVSEIRGEVRHQLQTFGDPSLVDSRNMIGTVRYERDMNKRVRLSGSVGFNESRADMQALLADPGTGVVSEERVFTTTQYASVETGIRVVLSRRASANAALGRNRVHLAETTFGDPTRRDNRSTRASAGLEFRGRRIRARGGYNQDLATGSGAFDVSRNETYHAGLGVTIHRRLTADLFANRTLSKRAQAGDDREVESRVGGVRLSWLMSDNLRGEAGYRVQEQEQDLLRQGQSIPDLNRFTAVTAGLVAVFD